MELCDARHNAVRTFIYYTKQFLTASNFDFSDIWYIRPLKIVLDLMHVKKDRIKASTYKQLLMEIRNRYHGYIPVCTYRLRDATVLASDTVISMRLPDSASIFTAKIIKALKKIFCCIQNTFMSLGFAIYEAGISLSWDGDSKECLFLNCTNKDIRFLLYTQTCCY